MSFIRRNRGVTVPPGPVMVNPHHPLASRMRSLILFDNVQPIDQIGQLGRFSKTGSGTIGVKTSQHGRYLDCAGAGVVSAYPLGKTVDDFPNDSNGNYFTTIIVGIQTVAANSSSEAAKVPYLLDTTGYYAGNHGLAMGNVYGSASGFYPVAPTGGAASLVTSEWWADGKLMVTGTAGQVITNKVYGFACRTRGMLKNGYFYFGAGGPANNGYYMQGGGPLLCYVIAGHLSDGEMSALTLNPTEPLLFQEDLAFGWLNAPAAASPISGTLSATLAAATLASTATVAIAGTSSATLAAATLSATGTVSISGTASATLAATTVVSAGTVALTGSTTATLAAATLAGTGTLSLSATLTATLGDATLAATGTAGNVVTGTLAVTLDAATLAAASTLVLRGTTTTTLANATLAGTGTLSLRATSSVTLGNVALSATGTNGNVVNAIVLVWNGVRI